MSAEDPMGSPLTYQWSAAVGTLEGLGATVTWKATDVNPGSYEIAGTATNEAGQAAQCRVSVTVFRAEAAPIPVGGRPLPKPGDNFFAIPAIAEAASLERRLPRARRIGY